MQRKPAIADAIVHVRRWAHALFREPTPVTAFATLHLPILYLLGETSPQSAHAVADVLIPVLPRVRVVCLARLGHMGPITHARRSMPRLPDSWTRSDRGQ